MDLQRYHPLTIVFDFYEYLRAVAIFAFLLFVVNYGADSLAIRIGRWAFLVVSTLTLITLIIKWLINKFNASERSFHLKSGIFKRTERTIFYDKVQNVHRHKSFLHKIFRTTSITFETEASGGGSKVVFKVVTNKEADRMEALVKEAGSREVETLAHEENSLKDSTEDTERFIHFTPTRRDIVKASFTSLSFLFLIVIVPSFFSQINASFNVENLLEEWIFSRLTSVWIVSGFVTVLILISLAVGLIRTYLIYGKYEIASDKTRIYITKGVLNETSFSILKKRVQAIEITQSVMKRLLGLAEVKLVSAGDLGDEEQEVSTLYPFLPLGRAYSIIEELLPNYKVSFQANRLPRISLVARLVKPYWIWVIITIILAYFKPEPFEFQNTWWVGSLGLFIFIIILRLIDYWNTRYVRTEQFIQLTYGAFIKTTYLTRRDKIVEVSVKRSKLQQLIGLASIGLINRAKPIRHESLADIPVQEAQLFYSWYAQRTKDIHLK